MIYSIIMNSIFYIFMSAWISFNFTYGYIHTHTHTHIYNMYIYMLYVTYMLLQVEINMKVLFRFPKF